MGDPQLRIELHCCSQHAVDRLSLGVGGRLGREAEVHLELLPRGPPLPLTLAVPLFGSVALMVRALVSASSGKWNVDEGETRSEALVDAGGHHERGASTEVNADRPAVGDAERGHRRARGRCSPPARSGEFIAPLCTPVL